MTFRSALKFNHYGAAQPISTKNGTLDMRAQVILLSRNVVIEGTDEDEWGCTIQTVGYITLENPTRIEGQALMQGVEIRGCG